MSAQQLEVAAELLGPLLADVVFVGGATGSATGCASAGFGRPPTSQSSVAGAAPSRDWSST